MGDLIPVLHRSKQLGGRPCLGGEVAEPEAMEDNLVEAEAEKEKLVEA